MVLPVASSHSAAAAVRRPQGPSGCRRRSPRLARSSAWAGTLCTSRLSAEPLRSQSAIPPGWPGSSKSSWGRGLGDLQTESDLALRVLRIRRLKRGRDTVPLRRLQLPEQPEQERPRCVGPCRPAARMFGDLPLAVVVPIAMRCLPIQSSRGADGSAVEGRGVTDRPRGPLSQLGGELGADGLDHGVGRGCNGPSPAPRYSSVSSPVALRCHRWPAASVKVMSTVAEGTRTSSP